MAARARRGGGDGSSEDEFDEVPHAASEDESNGEGEQDQEQEESLDTPADLERRALFDEVDADNSGYIDREELVVLAAKLGQKLKRKQLQAAMRELDPDGDEMITFEEFSKWWDNRERGGGGVFGGLFKKFWKKRSADAADPAASPGAASPIARSDAAPKQKQPAQTTTPTARAGSKSTSEPAPRAAPKLSSKGSFRGAIAAIRSGSLRDDSPKRGGGVTAALRSSSPRGVGEDDLAELGDRLVAALRDTAALQQRCDEQDVSLGSLNSRLELVESRAGANAKAIAAARAELQTWNQENSTAGLAAVQQRLEDAENQWASAAAANATAVRESKGAIAAMQKEVLETITGLSDAIRKKRCVHCGCVFTDGANSSHSCVYHPGERLSDDTWSCCNRRCGSGGRLVNGCLADFHRHMERATIRTPGLIPWATCPKTANQLKKQRRQWQLEDAVSAEID